MEIGGSKLTVLPAKKVKDPETMPPPAPPAGAGYRSRLGRKQVLEEERFVEALEDIIERDFFPELPLMERHVKWLLRARGMGTIEDRDTQASLAAEHKALWSDQRRFDAPSATPARSPSPWRPAGTVGGEMEEDEEEEEEDEGRAGGATLDTTGMSLTEFQRTHTSEDNESFQQILEQDQAERRRKYWWSYEGALDALGGDSSKPQLYIMKNGEVMTGERRAVMDKACETEAQRGDKRPTQLGTWKYRARNQLMFPPEREISYDTCRIDKPAEAAAAAARASQLTIEGGDAEEEKGEKERLRLQGGQGQAAPSIGWKAKKRRRVADEPSCSGEGKDEVGEGGKEGGGGRELDLREASASRRGPHSELLKKNRKQIQHRSTRLSGAFLHGQNNHARRALGLPPTPSPLLERPDSSRSSVMELDALEGVGGVEGEEGRRRGNKKEEKEYHPVTMTPLIEPGAAGQSPMMTWGEVDGTPLRLGGEEGGDAGGGGGQQQQAYGQALDAALMASALGGPGGGMGAYGQGFELKQQPRREALAHRLEAETAKKKSGGGGGNSTNSRGTSSSSSRSSRGRTPGGGAMTPAKQAVLSRLSTGLPRQATPFGGFLSAGSSSSRSRSRGGGGGGGGRSQGGSRGAKSMTPYGSGYGGGGGGSRASSSSKGKSSSKTSSRQSQSRTDGLLLG